MSNSTTPIRPKRTLRRPASAYLSRDIPKSPLQLRNRSQSDSRVGTPNKTLRKSSSAKFISREPPLGEQRRRWSRIEDVARKRQPSWVMGNLAINKYYKEKVLGSRSPGPVYKPRNEHNSRFRKSSSGYMGDLASREYYQRVVMAQKSPGPVYKVNQDFVMKDMKKMGGNIGTLAEKEYYETHIANAKSPGPVYNVNHDSVMENSRDMGGFMGSRASRHYAEKIEGARSPGPVYKPIDGSTSTLPPSRSSTMGIRRDSAASKEDKLTPGPLRYKPNRQSISTERSSKSWSFTPKRRALEDKLKDEIPGPGAYGRSIIPRFTPKAWRKKKKKIKKIMCE